jgi:menaquinone-dependent protoporphyrinogen IX oxidase
MKTMIIYATKTGHTEKIALSMGEQLGVTPKNISENPIIENVDLLLIGSGVYGGKSSAELIKFINSK